MTGDKVEREEREELLVSGDCVRAGGVRGVLLRGTAINVFHEQWVGRSLPLDHFWIKTVKEGIKRAHVEGGTQQRMRRLLSWEMLR